MKKHIDRMIKENDVSPKKALLRLWSQCCLTNETRKWGYSHDMWDVHQAGHRDIYDASNAVDEALLKKASYDIKQRGWDDGKMMKQICYFTFEEEPPIIVRSFHFQFKDKIDVHYKQIIKSKFMGLGKKIIHEPVLRDEDISKAKDKYPELNTKFSRLKKDENNKEYFEAITTIECGVIFVGKMVAILSSEEYKAVLKEYRESAIRVDRELMEQRIYETKK